MDLAKLTDDQLLAVSQGVRAAVTLRTTRRKDFFKPYHKQAEFFALGATKRERLYQAGNQLYGKSTAGAFETACHLTGEYPAWWTGRRWDRPTKGWAAGISSTLVRDISQSKLCGEYADAHSPDAAGWGTGMIPKETLLGRTLAHSVQYAFDSISVRHISGGVSTLGFKSYEQGRTKFQGSPLDFIWPDEEPEDDIYGEILARIAQTGGMVFITYTPLRGSTAVTGRFYYDDTPEAIRDRGVVKAGLKDIEAKPGETPEQLQLRIEQVISGYPAHERDARVNGEILLGEGAVWEGINADMIRVPAMAFSEVPLHWAKSWAVDFGIGHPFAAVLLGHDRETDIIYVMHEIKIKDMLPMHHVMMMRAVAALPPMSWPHDGGDREKGTGQQIISYYKDMPNRPGMRCNIGHATAVDGGYSTEAGVVDMVTRAREGRLRVFDTCPQWFQEMGSYYRKKGQIVKVNDDLMSATRIGVIDIRHAQPCALGPSMSFARGRRRGQQERPRLDPFTNRPCDEYAR